MKTKLFTAIAVLVVLVAAGLAGCAAQPAGTVGAADSQALNVNLGNQQTGIWVSGQGKITVTPDLAVLNLGITAQSTSVAEAQAQNAAAMEKLMAALTGSGIDKKDIQTQNFSIQQMTRWDDKNQQEIVTGYRVSNMVVVKIRDLDSVGAVIDASVEAGGDLIRINGIGFSVENPEKYDKQVRELAMNDAKEKAQQLASLSGVTLGKATYITESSYTPYNNYPVMYKGMDSVAAGAGTSISPGESEVSMNIQVAFSIE